MNLKSFQKLSYDKQLAMAEEMQEFVSLMKAQHFDPFKDYDWAMGCDLKAVNRDKVEIIRVPLLLRLFSKYHLPLADFLHPGSFAACLSSSL